MKKYLLIFYQPNQFFEYIAEKKYLKIGLIIWGINSVWLIFVYLLQSQNPLLLDVIFPKVNSLQALIVSLISSIIVIFAISFITNIISILSKGKNKFISILIAHLFIGIINIGVIPFLMITLLFKSSFFYKSIIYFSGIWEIGLSFFAISVIYKFSFKKTIIVGLISWFLFLIVTALFVIPLEYFKINDILIDTKSYTITDKDIVYNIPISEYKLIDGNFLYLGVNISAEITNSRIFQRNFTTKESCYQRIDDFINMFMLSEVAQMKISDINDEKINEINRIITEKSNDYLKEWGIRILKVSIYQG